MYYVGKIMQAAGLTFLLIAFLKDFPDLMSYKSLFIGLGLFAFGWIINKYLLKNG